MNEKPFAPFSATRAASAAVASMSQNGSSASGIWRPGIAAHHSSIIQSLNALTHAAASSLSVAAKNVLPANPGKVGKHSCAWIPSTSMSSRRALGS